jgi:hypothetical protein
MWFNIHQPEAGRDQNRLDVVLRQGSVTGVQLIMTLGTALVGVRLARGLADSGTGPAQGRCRADLAARGRPPGGDEAQQADAAVLAPDALTARSPRQRRTSAIDDQR